MPQNVKDLRSFLGLAGYYRCFVRHFSIIARPLTELLKKGAPFCWTDHQSQSFEALKAALTSAPVLVLPDFKKPFTIETDASGIGVGAVLMQGCHPLAFLSKALGPRSQGLSTYEKEYMAILLALDQWRAYLQYGEFHILTDQKSLSQLSEQRLHTPWQQKVFTKLLGLSYKIIYRRGTENKAADALSRYPTVNCAAISMVQPRWLADVQASYITDAHAQDIIRKLLADDQSVPGYTFSDGLLRYKSRIWVGSGSDPSN